MKPFFRITRIQKDFKEVHIDLSYKEMSRITMALVDTFIDNMDIVDKLSYLDNDEILELQIVKEKQ